jgi:hypothetical protein
LRLAGLLLAVLPACGCGLLRAETPREDPTHKRIRVAVERIRAVVHGGRASSGVKREIKALGRELKLMPRETVVPALIVALEDGGDEDNSVLIHLLDEMDATDWVPVRFRARTMTLESVAEIAAKGATRAEQADVYLTRIFDLCGGSGGDLAAAWLALLGEETFHGWQRDRRVDITPRVHGFAVLGLARLARAEDLDEILARLGEGKIHASPAILSQGIIHMSGSALRRHLVLWLKGPDKARAAACLAVDFLQLERPAPVVRVTAKEVNRSGAWAARLPAPVSWQAPVYVELKRIAEEAAADGQRKNAELQKRLAWARRVLQVPEQQNVLKWLTTQPKPAQAQGLARLAGIDLLVAPPLYLPPPTEPKKPE